eukprot:251193_1
MGNPISTVKAEAAKINAEDEKEANDALNSLMQVAKKNLQLFYAEVKSDKDKSEIPIDKIIKHFSLIQCGVTKDAQKLKDTITGILSDISNGKFLDGISKAVDIGLDLLLGNYA